MGLLLGYPEEVSMPEPFVTTKNSNSINENSAARSYSRDSYYFGDYERPLSPPNCKVECLSSGLLEDIRGVRESSSDSPPPDKKIKKAGKNRGRTMGTDQNLQYLDGDRWWPAVYHHHIRALLIEKASQNGSYTYLRERGLEKHDVTSFLESQKNWGPVRDQNWAEILYPFYKEKNYEDPIYSLKEWKFNGKVVISARDNQPILLFRDIPDTLSSALHGRDMEAMKRTDSRIRQQNIIARMPLHRTTQKGTRKAVISRSTIGMRMTRFREQEGVPSWLKRDGSSKILKALWDRLPLENQLANSIRGAFKPPTLGKQYEMKKLNAGNSSSRARKESLTPKARVRRQKIEELRLGLPQEARMGLESGDSDDGGSTCPRLGRPAKNIYFDGLAGNNAIESERQRRHIHDNQSMYVPSSTPAPWSSAPPATYQDFIAHGSSSTSLSDIGDDLAGGGNPPISPPLDFDLESFIADAVAKYSNMSPSQINNISSSPPKGHEFDPCFADLLPLSPPLPAADFSHQAISPQSHEESWDLINNNSIPDSQAGLNDDGNDLSPKNRSSSPHDVFKDCNVDYSSPGSKTQV